MSVVQRISDARSTADSARLSPDPTGAPIGAPANTRSPGSDPAPRRTVVFALAHAGYYRNFETVIRLLCAGGVNVRVHCSKEHASIGERDYELPQRLPGLFEFTI